MSFRLDHHLLPTQMDLLWIRFGSKYERCVILNEFFRFLLI